MIFRLRVPGPPLSDFVENLWFYQDLEVDHSKEKLLPDTAMELIIDLKGGPKKLYNRGNLDQFETYKHCWISGMQRRFIVIGAEPGSSMIGVHFRTGGAAPFFGFPLSELGNSVVELELIWKREILALREQLLEAPTIERKFDLLEGFLLRKAHSQLELDQAVAAALNTLRTWPALSLRELASRLGLSHKRMIASFDCRVGLTPKVTARLVRFQKAILAAHRAPADVDWSDFAVDCGYYDQAHLIHEFQDFAGLTPAEYQRSRTIYPHYVVVD